MDIRERMTAVFCEVFDDDSIEIYPEMIAANVESWDSITHINLIVALEQEFKLRFNTADVASMKNVGDLECLIRQKVNQA
ncbi:MAG: acyl carrier protein [Bryobacterales bacterium]|nr:acyl carrier protein [Bryobacterales bacterium]